MSQATFEDDDLFGEAAEETRAEVEEGLSAARAELPAADDILETDADNVLGALNGLKMALDVGDATEELRQAKKSFVLGERADAFEDAGDLEAELTELETLLTTIEEAGENANDLASTVPQLRTDLEETHEKDDSDE
ncbi:MAG: hypothetical protein A07HR60_00010 [uncultured archaeon A07HR60]|nr:MAG: hypothetical protein A07HR60_00010 [uncultured archaeon A07HR60]